MNAKPNRLLITDLDNTLYDWVTFFALSFRAMLAELAELLNADEAQLKQEFKRVHQHFGTSEQPFAVFDLPSVKRAFPLATRAQLRLRLRGPLAAFNRTRDETLSLYPGVRDSLAALHDAGVVVVGHTEATSANAYYRLTKLGIDDYFRHLYVLQGRPVRHPDPARAAVLAPPVHMVTRLPASERKPNPRVLLDICRREGIEPATSIYVGDSLTRDVSMALAAGITAAWARYGTIYDGALWSTLVEVTHWTDDDVAREAKLRTLPIDAPDIVLDSFAQLIPHFLTTPRISYPVVRSS